MLQRLEEVPGSKNVRLWTRTLFAIVALLGLSLPAAANTWYVSPSGTSSGDGSLLTPWDLQTALDQPAAVKPGDTILMLPGTYRAPTLDGFTSNLNGTAANPIIVRNYYGNDYSQPHAVIDAIGVAFALNVVGSYAQFQDFELFDSSGNRTGDTPALATGVFCQGQGNNFVGLVVHDTVQGFSSFNSCPNSDYDGNIAYFNGYTGTGRNFGHGMYMQNSSGAKNLWANFVGDNADEGLQIYGSGTAQITGFDIENNSLWNTSSWPAVNYQYNLVLGSGQTNTANTISNNYSWFNLSAGYGFVNIGQYTPSSNLTVQNNVFVGGWVTLDVVGVDSPFTFTGNTLVNSAYLSGTFGPIGQMVFGQFPGQSTQGYTWDFNNYYTLNSFEFGSTTDGNTVTGSALESFTQWQQTSHFDANSTFSSSLPSSAWVYINPDHFEAKRAGITIYNWPQTSTVSVNLSSVLSVGDNFVIRDAQNFFAPPVVTGTYNGGTISIPMTGLTKPCVIGVLSSGGGCPSHTAPGYGTFIVIVPNAGNTSSTPPNTLSVATTSLSNGQVGVSYSATLTAGGGVPPYQWTAAGLPAGLGLTSGIVTGVPTASGPYNVSLTVTDSINNTANVSVPLTIAPAPVNQAAVSFTTLDSSTQGNWSTNYGVSGYSLANGTSSIPSNVSLSIASASLWTWASPTSDARALQSGSSRIAACWYNGSAFTFNVNFPSTAQTFALYAIDWDNLGRSETIQIFDAVTHASLYSQQISGFSGGVYLVWQISGNVNITVTANAGPNAAVSGIFWGGGPSGAPPPPTPSISATSGTTQSAPINTAFTALAATVTSGGAPLSGVPVTFTAPASGATATFPGGLSTALATTDGSGIATSPVLTANGTAGGPYTVTATASGVTGTAAFALTNTNPQSGGGGPTGGIGADPTCTTSPCANFVAYDSVTQGSWQGVYGADGYSLSQSSQSVPSYAALSLQSQLGWVYGSGLTDTRALQIPNGTGRIAAAWYSPSPFTIKVNLTDGKSHQFSLYAVDWDGKGRSETIEVFNATTNAVLDIRNISNFGNGIYLTWNLAGSVNIVVTSVAGPNSIVNGVFFGGGTSGPVNLQVSPQSVNLKSGQTQQFVAYANGTVNQSVVWAISPNVGSISSTGIYTAPASISTPQTVGVIAEASAGGPILGTAVVNLSPGAVANFLSYDTTTQGSWQSVYGADGYSLAALGSKIPAYAAFSFPGAASYVWSASTSDPRALQLPPGSTGRSAATWYNASFSLAVNTVDGNLHQFAAYALDWDNQGRSETIVVTDANTNAILDIRSISAFTNGEYLIWNISGSVRITVTATAGPNAVFSGAFFK